MKKVVIYLIIVGVVVGGVVFAFRYHEENNILDKVFARLDAQSRTAQVLVTDVAFDDKAGRELTTIKFLEYDTKGLPLKAKYFTFSGSVLQFQSMSIRFDDAFMVRNNSFKGKAAYLFGKIVAFDGPKATEFEIAKVNQVPAAYKIDRARYSFEEALWRKFWGHVLQSSKANKLGIQTAQVEASGTMFVPGTLYTIRIEQDGSMKIDTQALSAILSGERIPPMPQ